MTIWFTSDWHLGHSNIIKSCNRPFASLKEMHEMLLHNHNSVVTPTDTVYHLGDLSYKINYEMMRLSFQRYNGKFHIIKGNHDKPGYLQSLKDAKLIESYQDVLGVSINGQYIWLSHYPHRSWNQSSHGSWHLHGHSHGNMPPFMSSFDVGTDNWNYFPISFEQVSEKMTELKNSS